MGRCFERLGDEYPRESYKIITKVGKYGVRASQHTYDRETVLASVKRSLKRLKTDYLDVVCKSRFILALSQKSPLQRSRILDRKADEIDLHDVEFVTSAPFPSPGGNHLDALKALKDSTSPDPFHLRQTSEPVGKGDENILEGLGALAELREQGMIKKIGIAAYPLPLLLRIALLAKNRGIKIDIVQTYAQQTVLTPLLATAYLSEFEKAGITELTNAAPLAMGILTTNGGPDWHPAKTSNDGMYDATREASRLCQERGTSIENVALDFGFRELKLSDGKNVPVVVGCKSIQEIKRTVEHWREVNVPGVRGQEEDEKARETEREVIELFEKRQVRSLTWQNPAPENM